MLLTVNTFIYVHEWMLLPLYAPASYLLLLFDMNIFLKSSKLSRSESVCTVQERKLHTLCGVHNFDGV